MEASKIFTAHERRCTRSAAAARRRTLPNRVAYALVAGVIGARPVRLGHAVAALPRLQRALALLAADADADLRDLCVRGAREPAAGRRASPTASAAGPSCSQRSQALMASTVLFLLADSAAVALRRPRHPGPRHRRGVQRGQRGAARPAPAPRPRRRRAHQRDRGDGRASGSGSLVSSVARPDRLGAPRSCPTLVLFVLSRSRSPAPTGCPSPCSTAQPLPARRRASRASRPPSAAPSSSPLSPSSPPGRSAPCSSRSARSSPGTCSTRPTRSSRAVGIVALAGSAAIAQLLTARTAPWVAASPGSIALAAGMILIVASRRDRLRAPLPRRARSSAAPASAPRSWVACAPSWRRSRPSIAPRSCPRSTSPPTPRCRCRRSWPGSWSRTSRCKPTFEIFGCDRRRDRAGRRLRGVADPAGSCGPGGPAARGAAVVTVAGRLLAERD